MIRAMAGLLALFAVGYPFGLMAGSAAAALSLLAGTLCAWGILGGIPRLVVLGASVAMLEYTLAVFAYPAFDLTGALALGVALSLLFQLAAFDARFRGAFVERRVVREHLRAWTGAAAAAVVLGLALAIAADGSLGGLPAPVYPVAAAAGVVLAFAGVVRAALRGAPASEDENV